MAIMQTGDRVQTWKDMIDEINLKGWPCNVAKTDLQAAVDAVDQWVSDNAASYNSALPVAARTTLTTTQKAGLLMLVLKRRYLVGA